MLVESSIAAGGEGGRDVSGKYLVRTGDNLRKFIWLLLLALHHGLEDGWVIGAKVNEAMGDTSLNGCVISAPWGTVFVVKRTSQSASKKANEAV